MFDAPSVAAGAGEDWWAQACANLEREEYYASRTEGELQAPNRAQNLRTCFRSDGVELVPRTEEPGGWRWRWQTEAWGRAGRMRQAPAAAPVAQGARVEYRRAGLIEWYENRSEGVEQGFTLATRPMGAGALRIQGRISDDLRARASAGGNAVDFTDESGALVLRYGKLVVWDARGTRLNAHLEVGDGTLAIEVEDRGATYPVTIDPLMTTPAWTAESDQAFAEFGYSVATAGDVNGDGYSDVIVGAYLYDNGETDEGRAFVFHGSASGLAVSPAWTAESDQVSAEFGASVATAGDVNGDGYSDVIVGARQYDNGETDEGRAFLYHGSASGLAAGAAWTAESDQAGANFGYSVATAGDVNGDGYSDVIVGAFLYDNGQANEGRAFVYHGSASGLAVSPAWSAEGNQAVAEFGRSVAAAGDVNGDGYSDVIVGAYQYANVQASEGRAFVYHGSATGLAVTAAWIAEINQAGALFGISVATAGDVNGDGYSDVIVGAYFYDNAETNEGRAFVYHGSATGLALTAAWTAESDQASANFGVSVATAGDVNGDGYSDVIVGAFQCDNGQTGEGRAFVYHGSASGLAVSAAWTAESNQASAHYGVSVASAGDVNGDGYSDVIIGAWQYDNGQTDEGRAFVYHGSALGLAVTAAWTAESDQATANFGISVASAGDINGDGYSDVIVGAYRYDNGETDEGRAFVYHGSATGLAVGPAWTAESDQADASFGISVATAGDVDGDGYSDVIVGAYRYDNGETDEGRAFVYHGSASGLAVTTAWTAETNQATANFGISVASAGDVDGDGYSDVIVGSYRYDNGQSNEGRAFVYHGSATGLAVGPAWTAESDQADASFGISVATAGDVDGDGYSDVIVGADQYDNGQTNEGRAFVYLGSATGLEVSPGWTAESDQASANFGSSVATAGDVNGNGCSDVIVGSSRYDNGQANEGRAFVYNGSASGLAVSAAWTAESNQDSAFFGVSVATAGDVNGDGFSDVIVGAYKYDGGQSNEGRAFVYHGSGLGLAATPAWTAESNLASAFFGYSVAAVGDVNGDGYSDVIAGAYLYDAGQTDEGRAFVHYGNGGDGLDRIPRQRRADDSAPMDLLGRSQSDSFRLKALGRSPAGRSRVRMEYEVKPLGAAFDGASTRGASLDTGAPAAGIGSAAALNELVSGLALGMPHHWRLRVLSDSPFFPRSPWFSLASNSPAESDLRTGSTTTAVSEPGVASGALRVETIRPNPFRSQAILHYVLPRAGRIRLSIHDVLGRRVALLADGVEEAGMHSLTWEGRDARGEVVRPGVYWARLESGGEAVTRKLVRR